MTKNKGLRRILAALLSGAMLAGLYPAGASAKEPRIIEPKQAIQAGTALDLKDRSANRRDARKAGDLPAAKPAYNNSDVVRVSVILDGASTLDKGYDAEDLTGNSAAVRYRENLKKVQNDLTEKISKNILGGRKLDVVWNLTFAANLVSANVEYGKIGRIKTMPGVKDVVIETRYLPAVYQREADSPFMSTANPMVGAPAAWASDYTGAGSIIAVIDTGIDLGHQSFDSAAFDYALGRIEESGKTVDLLTADEVTAAWDSLNASRLEKTDPALAYRTSKIPFAVNYVDGNMEVTHTGDREGEHGSHVAGIAAANKYVPDGNGGFENALEAVRTQGEAPDAQILVMKVFGQGGGAYDSDYMAAVEDALILGADVVNLSLGSSATGYASNDEYAATLDRLAESNVVWAGSAGNSGSWGDEAVLGSLYGAGYLYGSDVGYATVGSPGTYANTLSVASVDNTGFTGEYLSVDGEMVFFSESNDYGNPPLASVLGGQTLSYVYLDNTGVSKKTIEVETGKFDEDGEPIVEEEEVQDRDFFAEVAEEISFSGKIAMCNRGASSFTEKANAAAAQGASAVIIGNNQDGTIIMNLTGYEGGVPAVSVTQADAAMMKAAGEEHTTGKGVTYYVGELTVSADIGINYEATDGQQMSSFSSWGVPGDLSLKPEITAPGGSIYSVFGSALNDKGKPIGGTDKYERLSGTSMAAPQVAGLTAVFAQYIRENGLVEKTGLTQRQLIQSLFMSTAVPLLEENEYYGIEYYYPVLRQGAGLVNVENAMNAKSFLMMDSSATPSAADGKIKAELGDDPDRNGVYEVTFTVHNMSDEEVSYSFDGEFFTQDVWSDGEEFYKDLTTYPLYADIAWTVDGKEFEPGDSASYDFNGDGLLTPADMQIILDYVVGNAEEADISNFDMADLNGNGTVDTDDAYQILLLADEGTVSVPAGGEITVTASIAPDPEDLAYFDFYCGGCGVYLEGYLFVTESDSEDGALGVEHSIPVLGYYGSWSEPSMFDKNNCLENDYRIETRLPYMYEPLEGEMVGGFFMKQEGSTDSYFLGGNPWGAAYDFDVLSHDFCYSPERNAVNTENARIAFVRYTQIRNSSAGLFTVTDAEGNVLYEKFIDGDTGAYFSDSSMEWMDTVKKIAVSPDLSSLEEGDTFVLKLVLAPEYYGNGDSIDWDALGKGAVMELPLTVDNTAPVFTKEPAVTKDDEGNPVLTFAVKDNQYIAGMYVGDWKDNLIGDSGSEYGKAPGSEYEYEVSLAGEDDKIDYSRLLIEVTDYAGNTLSRKLNLTGEDLGDDYALTISSEELNLLVYTSAALTVTAEPWGRPDEVKWTSADEKVAAVDENGIVTAVGKGETVVTATSVNGLYPETSVTCKVKVDAFPLFGALQDEEGNPLLFSWDPVSEQTWSKYKPLDAEFTAAAFNSMGDQHLYLQDWQGILHEVDSADWTTIETSDGPSAFGAPMEDIEFAYAYNRENDARAAVGIYGGYFLLSEDIMDNTFTNGWGLGDYLSVWTGASSYVAVAWAGFEKETGCDVFYVLDDAGAVWGMYVDVENGTLNLELYGTDLEFTCAPMDDDEPMGNSMILGDDGCLYLSHYDSEADTSVFYALIYEPEFEYDEEAEEYYPGFRAIPFRDAGEGVWPAFILTADLSEPEKPGEEQEPEAGSFAKKFALKSAGPSLRSAPKSPVEIVKQEIARLEGMDAADYLENARVIGTVQMQSFSANTPAPTGGLNAVSAEIPPRTPDETEPGEPAEEAAPTGGNAVRTVVVTADEDTHNGLRTVEYDETLAFSGVKTFTQYGSVRVDEENRTVTFGYVSRDAIAAGRTLAEVTFTVKDGEFYGNVTVSDSEANGGAGTVIGTVIVGHRTVSSAPVFYWSAKYNSAVAVFTFEDDGSTVEIPCETVIDESAYRPAGENQDGRVVYTATVTGPNGETYTEAKEEPIPAIGPQNIFTTSPEVPSQFLRDVRSYLLPVKKQEAEGAKAAKETKEPEAAAEPAVPEKEAFPFEDVLPADPYRSDVEYVWENGIMNGFSETEFAPDKNLRRAEVVTILYRVEGEPETPFRGTFSDVEEGLWYSDAIEWAAENGIVKGYPSGKFGPDDLVTREQLAAILHRYAGFKGYSADIDENTNYLSYNDVFEIADYAKLPVFWSLENGILTDTDGDLNPTVPALRHEVASAIRAFCENVAK